MRLIIVAATGGIGRHLLRQAIEAGHDVTAIARSPEKITDPVRTVFADLANPDVTELAEAVKGSDAVLPASAPGRISRPAWPGVARKLSSKRRRSQRYGV
ncbi:NAD(P)H-binding protein [Actinoplanes sp. NPDC051513]|uniref:NAD(P)H-binding protein n=1 Tax=Actinoplanes sp. NPDC051513 TaxID=3363908 RepID=UPI0037A5B8DF